MTRVYLADSQLKVRSAGADAFISKSDASERVAELLRAAAGSASANGGD
jgi:hypothetical protein